MDKVCIPNVVLNASLNRHHNVFNIAHFNGCSVLNKLDEVRQIFRNTSIHAICVSETWFDDSVSEMEASLPGHRLIRADRNDPNKVKGGGVAIYVRKDISCTVKFRSKLSNVDILLIELKLDLNLLLVAVIYKPPDVHGIGQIESVLNKYIDQYSDILVLGDLNINALNPTNPVTQSFKSFLEACSLYVVNTEPTHFIAEEPTLIDYIITSDLSKIVFWNQFSISGISKHDLVYCSYKLNVKPVKREIRYYRAFNDINLPSLITELITLNWNAIFETPDVNEQVEIFNTYTDFLFKKFVPLKKVKSRNLADQIWFDNDIRKCIIERDLAYECWKRSKREADHLHYKHLRNHATAKIRTKKRNFFTSVFSPDLSTKQLWSKLDQLGVQNSNSNEKIQLNPNELNSFFSQCNSRNLVSLSELPLPPKKFNFSSFSFKNITSTDLLLAINQVKSNAIGTDNISLKFIKLIFPWVDRPLLHIVNHIITTSSFPTVWKNAKILPLAKVKTANKPSDFRPISILSALSKAVEKILKEQISIYLNDNKLLDCFQSGFRKSHGTTSALLRISHDLFKNMEDKKVTALVLLDFTKAFDTVPHMLLIRKLLNMFNFSTAAASLIRSYLDERTQTVFVNDVYSDLAMVTRGVPQGSVLGPLLFSLYINDLPNILRNASYHLFADDFQIYLPFHPEKIVDKIAELNIELKSIERWAVLNGLTLNENKTKYILVKHQNIKLTVTPDIIVNDTHVACTEKVIDLGLLFNHNLKWEDNTNRICAKIYFILRRLWRFAHSLPYHVRFKLFQSLLLPHFVFNSPVFANLNFICSYKLKMAFHSCVRFVFLLRKYDHISNYSNRLLNLPLRKYLDVTALVFLFKLIRSKAPVYLYSILTFCKSTRTLNLVVPKHHYLATGNAFFVHVVKLWNDLPSDVKKNKTVGGFRRECLGLFASG